ncbi:MAG: ABC transporter substrate-binding protein, partial [Rhodospirillaceae bacterium]|nr:ABC transporter substrate-binding protein [Rhodospirillaceae bacterium]
MTANEYYGWLSFGEGMALWRELYERFDAVPFYAGSSGEQAGGWFTRPIDTIEDFKGLKIRIAGLARLVLERLGAEAVLLPPSEIAAAMTSGELDAADWIGPWNDIAAGLCKAARYYYMPGWHEPGPAVEVTVAHRAWEALDGNLKAIVQTAAAATAQETLADFTYHNIAAYPQLASLDVEIRSFSPQIIDRLKLETDEVVS